MWDDYLLQQNLVFLLLKSWMDVWMKFQVSDEQEGNQLMVVNEDGDLTGNQVMVVEDANGLEALTVLTQADNTHHYIVYVQEHTVEIN